MENKVILKRTLVICLIMIIIDQITKILAIIFCSSSDLEIINKVFYITKTENIGIAFSLNQDNLKNIFITAIIIGFIIKYLFSNQKFLNTITLTSLDFVLAGGISNLIDRIFRGGVIDFIKILDFPIFNIADISIVCGWIFFAFYIIKFEISKK